MEIEEFYDKIGGDYAAIKKLLMKDGLISRFVIAFLDDTSFLDLKKAMEEGDMDKAFSCAHTLKGVSANIAFTKLYQIASVVTEGLRNGKDIEGAKKAFEELAECYEKTISMIHLYKSENDI